MKTNTQALTTFVEDKYIPLQKKHKIIGAVSLLIFPLILFFFLFYQPKNDEIATLTQQRDAARQELTKAKATAATLDKHKGEMAAIQEKFEDTSVLFPREKEIPRLLTDISTEGQQAGLEFLTFKPLPAVPKDFYSEIPVEIQVRGPYHNLGGFLDKVSKLDRIVTVSNIKITAPQKSDEGMLLNASCKLITYQFTNKKIETAPAGKENKKVASKPAATPPPKK